MNESFYIKIESFDTYEQVTSHIYMRHITHEEGMGWLRLVGSLKLDLSFAEHSLFYRALLQKRPIILRSLLIVATPYERWVRARGLLCHSLTVTHTCESFTLYMNWAMSQKWVSYVTRINRVWVMGEGERSTLSLTYMKVSCYVCIESCHRNE